MSAQLFIFEGPDGTGKTTLSHRLVDWLGSEGRPARYVSFPGQSEGSLGEFVYNLHHYPERYGLHRVNATALQLLHVAAHIDSLHHTIIPALERGEFIVMDRFWWSTIVYGKAAGIDTDSLRLMIDLELVHWSHYRPTALFLLERSIPARVEHLPGIHELLCHTYADLEQAYNGEYSIYRVSTSGSIDESFGEILSRIRSLRQSESSRVRGDSGRGA